MATKATERHARVKFTLEAGCLIRGHIRKLLDREKFSREGTLNIRYYESKGVLESDFIIKVDGPESAAMAWVNAFRRYVESISD